MGEVILGLPGPWAENYHEVANHYTTKIGGMPDWPIPNMDIGPNLLSCRLCGERLSLVAQVYAPISLPKLKIEERVIYILGCRMPECGSNPRSWQVVRVQKCHGEKQLGSANPEVIPLGDDSSSISKISNSWLEDLASNTFGEHDDDGSDGDVDLEELSWALSQAASQASHMEKQNTSRRSEPVKFPESKARLIDANANTPVLPCFYIYSQKEQVPGDIGDVCANYSSLSINGNVTPPSDHEEEEKWEGETYEYDRALGADRTYLKFKKQMDAYPGQCFRYSYGGNPLVAARDRTKPDPCQLCGSSRQYEMQLMPPLLYFLHQAADGSSSYAPEEWSWLTLIVYTCPKSCCPVQCEEKSGSCGWAVAEEAIIIQYE